MRLPDEVRRDLVRQWIGKAEQDLTAAEILLMSATRLPSVIAFHAQQAVEKYLKAILVRHQVYFPKTMIWERSSIWLGSASLGQPKRYRNQRCSRRSGPKAGIPATRRNSFPEKRHALFESHAMSGTW
jgi:hypothetical protein